jgi:hypothetical protein
MNEDFIFRVGADIDGFTKSISQVEAELKKVKTELKTQTGAAIVETNKYIVELQASIKNLNEVGLSKLPKAATAGTASLNALGQVARDAPFGFIAIQNNLPILFDQLGTLSQRSGGAAGALKEIGSALVGPAGVTFAIGAVISGITVLVQKYGSVGEGIKVLLGINKELTEAQKAFNKATNETSASLITEDYKVQALTKTLLNQKASQKDRIAAYGELVKIAPDVVAGISKENALTNESSLLIESNAKARKELITLKIQEAGITAALTTNETKLAELRNKLTIADQNYVKSAADLNKSNKVAIITGFASQSQQQIALKTLNDNIASVQELRNQISVLTKENQNYLNQLDPTINGIAKINQNTRERVDGLKQLTKAQKEAAKGDAIGTITEGEQLNNGVVTSNLDFLQRVIAANVRLTNASVDEMIRYRDSKSATPLDLMPKKLSKVPALPMSKELEQQIGSTKLMLDELERSYADSRQVIGSVFFNPLQDLFENFLNTGKFAFAEFGKAVLKAINQVVAKIIATGIISLLATIMSGGFSAAAGGAAGGLKTVLGSITSALGFGGGQKVAAPSFSGVSGGGMQMAGAVNLTLRGSDLVGSINRTNSTISRVG